jgi:hypothetical protein
LHLDEDGAGIVADEPGQAQFASESVHERTKTDPLHNAGHREPLPNVVGSHHQRRVGHVGRQTAMGAAVQGG